MYGRDSDEFAQTSRYARRGGVSPGLLVIIVLLTAATSVFGAMYFIRTLGPAQEPLRIRELSIAPSKIGPGKTAEVRMLWRGDPEAEARYAVPEGARIDGTGPLARLSAGTLEAGPYLLHATVSARDGRTADGYALFTVGASRPPATPTITRTEQRLDCDNGRFRVRLHGESIDPDGDPVTLRWVAENGTLAPPQGPDVQVTGSMPESSIKVTVRATAADASNESPPATFEFRVGMEANCD